jgi:AAHS family 4-hydroxybenzoate transporter-like MFS transporter
VSAPAQLDVARLVDDSRLGAFQIGIFVLCGLCLMMDGFDVQAMGYVAPEIIREWNVAPARMGQVLSAAPFGILIGSLLFSMLADRFGRRPVLIAVTLYFAILTLLTARAASPTQLLVIRVIAGIGLGGIMPNAVALCGEFSPKASRVTVMMVVANCFSAGAALGGFLAAWLIPRFGWRSVFYFGGAVPLVIGLVMMVALPESLQFLALRGANLGKLRAWLKRVAPGASLGPDTRLTAPQPPRKGVPLVQLFDDGRGWGTVALWVINFMNLLNLYFLANWLPAVARDSGYPPRTAVLVAATLQLAGTAGAFLLGWLVHKAGFVPVLATGFTLASVNIYLIGQPGHAVATMFLVVGLAGVGIVGGQAGVNALAATYYPTDLRSTGVGAGLGIGRTGAIAGPAVAGYLIGMQWSSDRLFLAAAVPALISAVVVLAMRPALRPGAPSGLRKVPDTG